MMSHKNQIIGRNIHRPFSVFCNKMKWLRRPRMSHRKLTQAKVPRPAISRSNKWRFDTRGKWLRICTICQSQSLQWGRQSWEGRDNCQRLTWPLKLGLLPDIQGRGKGQDDQRNSPVRRADRPQEYIAIRWWSLTWWRREMFPVAHSAF